MILLWAVTAALTAWVLGWYMTDAWSGQTAVRTPEREAPRASSAPLDLNDATVRELEELPEIGPALAERIVAWRAEHGPFREPEDVTDVPGIGPAVYEAIAPYIESKQEDGP